MWRNLQPFNDPTVNELFWVKFYVISTEYNSKQGYSNPIILPMFPLWHYLTPQYHQQHHPFWHTLLGSYIYLIPSPHVLESWRRNRRVIMVSTKRLHYRISLYPHNHQRWRPPLLFETPLALHDNLPSATTSPLNANTKVISVSYPKFIMCVLTKGDYSWLACCLSLPNWRQL